MASNKNYMLNDKFPKHIKNATSTSDGMMSSQDKTRLDNLFEFGLLSPATPDKDGIMTKDDKAKLDSLDTTKYVHPDDENTRHVSDIQINRWDNQIFYNNDKPTPIDIGGIKKGTTFDNVDYATLFSRLLYPYIEPSISNISITPNITIMEKGYTGTLTRCQFTINSPSTDGALYYDFKINNTSIRSLNLTNRTIDLTMSHTFKDNCTLSVTVTDNENNREKTFNLNNYTFVYPFYYGSISENDIIDEDLIKSKTKIIQNKSDKILKFTTNNQKILFAYPKSYGKLNSIFDSNNFNILNTFTVNEINIIGLDEQSIPYYVYTNELSSVVDYSMKFSF